MSVLKISDLTHAFGDNTLLHHISFDLNDGEKMGLVGLNGSGKSTLLKILNGEMTQEDGTVAWRPGTEVGYLDQYAEADGSLSILDYVRTAFHTLYAMETQYNELNERLTHAPDVRLMERAAALQQQLTERGFYDLEVQIEKVCAGLGVTKLGMDTPMGRLSGGQRAKVILAKLLLDDPDVLIMDEPTNFLDKAHIEWLTKYLRGFKGTFIIVSHHYAFLDGITNCICEIEFQAVTKYRGNLSAYLSQKDARKRQYVRDFHAQQKQIERTEEYIARNKARASTANLAKSRAKMLARVDRMPPPKENPVPRFRFPCTIPGSGRALEAMELVVGYTRPLLPAISFRLPWGGVLAVTGFNGIGKTTLARTLMSELLALSGGFQFHERAEVGYFSQEYQWPDPTVTPCAYIQGLFPTLNRKEAMGALARAGVGGRHATQAVGTLSGGECAKVRLCVLSLRTHNVLILDEPTNHLDVAAKESLREALAAFDGAVVLISHEKGFSEGLADAGLDIEKLLKQHAKRE